MIKCERCNQEIDFNECCSNSLGLCRICFEDSLRRRKEIAKERLRMGER